MKQNVTIIKKEIQKTKGRWIDHMRDMEMTEDDKHEKHIKEDRVEKDDENVVDTDTREREKPEIIDITRRG